MRRVVILQPSFLPWLGYLDQYAWADVFVFYDNAQFDKHGWRNRNRILTKNGTQWLTIPVLTKGQGLQRNSEVRIDPKRPWARKIIACLQQNYGHTPYFSTYFPKLQAILTSPPPKLIDLNTELLYWLTQALNLPWKVQLASPLCTGEGKTEKLVAICRRLQATDYLSGHAAKNYLDERSFENNSIKLHWHDYPHPKYPQEGSGFEPYLSTVDLLFRHGPASLNILHQTH